MATELARAESSRDDLPLVLLGMSMGGMLAFDVAGRTGRAAAVVATNLLDPGDPRVRRGMSRPGWVGAVAEPLLRRTARATDRLLVPIGAVAPVRSVAADERVAELVASDPGGGGTSMPAGWLRTYLASRPSVAPEDFSGCPVVLAHPGADRWTPPP